ncbi:thymidylate synthase [bacterium]|nr:thymidylate synthase [bacterium]
MNTLDNQYKQLLGTVLHNGINKSDRTGTGTKSVFGKQIRHDMSDGFPILTTKRVPFKTMVTELRWFLKGRTDIKYLQDNNCKIWDGDYEKSGRTDGGLGPIYGKQWRGWKVTYGSGPTQTVDQLKELITNIKENPDSRRLIVSAWNVGELDQMTLPPCHYSFQCYVSEGKLSLMWNQRSADLFLGVPFNISSYGLLLLLLCETTGLKPGTLIGSFGDMHLYQDHIAAANTQLTREIHPLPSIKLSNVNMLDGEFDVELVDYKHEQAIKAPLSN